MTAIRPRVQIAALIRTWLLLDFFGDARRAGNEQGSSLTTNIMWQSLLSLAFAALLYPDVPPVAFAAANLCLSTLLIGIGSLGDEERPLRLAADANLLAAAPVSRTTVVLARTGHASFQLVLVTAGMALAPAILLAHLQHDWRQAPAYVAAACACSGLVAGGLATLQSLAARLIGAARATLTMGTIKAFLLGAGFVLFALGLQRLGKDADALPIGRIGAELLPPYHAARLLADPAGELWRLLPWMGVAFAMLATTIALSATPFVNATRVSQRQPLRRLLRRIAGRGPRLGIAEFVAVSMWRSAGFRARVLPLLGLPAGMIFLTLGGERTGSDFVLICLLLQLPGIYLPFLIAFLPRADQAGTGWVFTHAPGITRAVVCDATWRALVTHVLVPVYALALVLVVAVGPDRLDRAAAALFSLGLAALAAEPMARLIDRVPFTDDREQDRGLDLGSLFAGALVLGGLGTLYGGGLAPWLRWPVAALTLGSVGLRLWRRPAREAASELLTEPESEAADEAPMHNEQGAEGAIVRHANETEPAQHPEPVKHPEIGRELRAVAVLYAALCVLPWLIGAAFAA